MEKPSLASACTPPSAEWDSVCVGAARVENHRDIQGSQLVEEQRGVQELSAQLAWTVSPFHPSLLVPSYWNELFEPMNP